MPKIETKNQYQNFYFYFEHIKLTNGQSPSSKKKTKKQKQNKTNGESPITKEKN